MDKDMPDLPKSVWLMNMLYSTLNPIHGSGELYLTNTELAVFCTEHGLITATHPFRFVVTERGHAYFKLIEVQRALMGYETTWPPG